MAVIYSQPVINQRLQVAVDFIDGGSGSGLLKIGTSGMSVILSTVVLAKPCATVGSGVMTFSGLPLVDGSAAASGTPAEGEVTDSDGNVVISGLTVGTAGAEIIISQATIDAGDIVTFLSGTITGA